MVVTEGSSSAFAYGGNHTGMYRDYKGSAIEFHGLAVGGSGLNNLIDRIDVVLVAKPDLVSVYIGANDLTSYSSADAFASRLQSYVEQIRRTGAKVVICTILPRQTGSAHDARYNAMRKEVAEIIRKVDWVDGVVDFANDPQMGPDDAPFNRVLYKTDGVHPTDGSKANPPSGQMVLFEAYRPIMDKLLADVR
ncbi:SGNH/GDSL hydrolase family protein [Leptolyngbya sp. 15MV]|nr:SGNH/GDSL hydrolase family protein [Leptolyngbya sp. 15MV]